MQCQCPAASGDAAGNTAKYNAESVLRRLLDRLARPQALQRLGAALALRQCAPRLRQQPELASDYLLELLRALVLALEQADGERQWAYGLLGLTGSAMT